MNSIVRKFKTAVRVYQEDGVTGVRTVFGEKFHVLHILARKLQTARLVFQEKGFIGVFAVFHEKAVASKVYWFRSGHRIRGMWYRLFPVSTRSQNLLRILYVVNNAELSGGQTVRYRVFNIIEALKEQADASYAKLENGVYLDDWQVARADIIVCMRIYETPELCRLFALAKQYGKPTVFDIDDLIFLPDFYPEFCRSLMLEDMLEKWLFADAFYRYYQAFLHCDYATASTPFIAAKMRDYQKQALVIHNGINHTQLAAAHSLPAQANESHSFFRICYMSGSKTHNVDFEQAKRAIARILSENRQVQLCVIGYLDENLSSHFSDQIVRVPFMPWQKLLAYSASCDVNIAPLDTASSFCHAKSELKFFEAALVGLPTVASATDTFCRCIRNGENGMLAETEDDWYCALKRLIDDRNFYMSMRDAAHKSAMAQYVPSAIAKETLEAYQTILKDWRVHSGSAVKQPRAPQKTVEPEQLQTHAPIKQSVERLKR